MIRNIIYRRLGERLLLFTNSSAYKPELSASERTPATIYGLLELHNVFLPDKHHPWNFSRTRLRGSSTGITPHSPTDDPLNVHRWMIRVVISVDGPRSHVRGSCADAPPLVHGRRRPGFVHDISVVGSRPTVCPWTFREQTTRDGSSVLGPWVSVVAHGPFQESPSSDRPMVRPSFVQ